VEVKRRKQPSSSIVDENEFGYIKEAITDGAEQITNEKP
jgi:hypothetical protein